MKTWVSLGVSDWEPSYVRLLTYLLIYLLTYSMEQSPSREANRFSASQEIPRILWIPKVHYRIHNCSRSEETYRARARACVCVCVIYDSQK
jgi:hypothetical protein